MTYNDLVNRTQSRLRCNLCMSPERSVRKAMLKAFPDDVSINVEVVYIDGERVDLEMTLDGKYCIDGIILEAVKRNNDLYGSGSNRSENVF